MEQINLPPFYVGQKVVYLDKTEGIFLGTAKIKKHDVCTVTGMELTKGWKISDKKEWFISVAEDTVHIYYSGDFVPIETTFQEISYEKVMEEEKKLISVN